MDLKLTDNDIDMTAGDVSWVEGGEAVRQDVEMTLNTWLSETPYDTSAGVPYLQIIFKRGTTPSAIRFIIEQIIRDCDGVDDVLELSTDLDRPTRVLTISGRARVGTEVVDFGPVEVTP